MDNRNLSNKEKKSDEKYRGNAINLLLILLTSVLAPLISHFLDLLIESGHQWTTERILVLFFSAISSHIVFDKIERILKEKKLWDKGFTLGNSYALHLLLISSTVSLVMLSYDSLFGAILILLIVTLAIIIIWRDLDEIKITSKDCLLLVICIGIYVLFFTLYPPEKNGNQMAKQVCYHILCQVLVCTAWDVLVILITKRKPGKKATNRKRQWGTMRNQN